MHRLSTCDRDRRVTDTERRHDDQISKVRRARPVDRVVPAALALHVAPRDLDAWLRFHWRALGVRDFFLRVEDTPELAPTLAALARSPKALVAWSLGQAYVTFFRLGACDVKWLDRQMFRHRRSHV